VVDSDPPAETVMARGAPVGLLLSAGVAKTSFVMPDVLGREAVSVKRQLESLGFHVVLTAGAAATGPVVYQDPSAGSRVTLDATVTLRVMARMIR
jgi:beta-lactam-binding protein with PASTA domain